MTEIVHPSTSRMSDFLMRLLGFMAIGRVFRRHGVSLSVWNQRMNN